ncbi:MAG: 3-dehydroquinate synthase [Candidatus Magasanikbacteria bacterium]|nr:3-dehydroquinate synthase [Candidatus Magasanikbacteria bacterium]
MNTKSIQVRLGSDINRTYSVLIGSGLFDILAERLAGYSDIYRFALISDKSVADMFAEPLMRALREKNLDVESLAFPTGEEHKNQATKTLLDSELLKRGFGRDSMIIALGGGVSGDMAGFVAATYMRGIPYVHVPTTFLSMVDSSIGGKTGVNTAYGKNLIGAYHQPRLVLQDLKMLKDLPEHQMVNGLFEAIKMFCTSDADMFAYVRDNREALFAKDQTVLLRIVEGAVKIKAGIVSMDERESNERMLLNFGHTIGHALELLSDYRIPHGYAVACGMIAETKMAELAGIAEPGLTTQIKELLVSCGLDTEPLSLFNPEDVLSATAKDKKTRKAVVRYIQLERIGEPHRADEAYAVPVDGNIALKALKELKS